MFQQRLRPRRTPLPHIATKREVQSLSIHQKTMKETKRSCQSTLEAHGVRHWESVHGLRVEELGTRIADGVVVNYATTVSLPWSLSAVMDWLGY